MDVPAVRCAKVTEQPVQRRHVAEVEELELRHDPPFLGPGVEIADERPRIAEHLVAEVDRAAGERAGVGCRVEHRQPAGETVGDGAAGGQLHDQVGALPQRRDRVGEAGQVQRRLRPIVADVHVDDRRTGRLALLGRGDQFVKGDRERGDG